ncbi:MAG: tripartite tricarboxylate transporter substrate binding protein [Pusillimonas sp.]
MLPIRYLLSAVACALALAPVSAIHAKTQNDYPNKPITVVVGFPPGTSVDNVARILAEQFSKRWKQPVIVDNRAGASGAIGAASVSRANADGYTLLLSSSGPMTINPHVRQNLNYSPLKDFAPIGQSALLPYMLVSNPSLPASTVGDLAALAKKDPEKYTYGSIGTGSTSHLIMALLLDASDIKMTHVPYGGSGQVQTDVIAGNIDMAFDTVVANMPMVKSGRLKAIAVSTPERSPLMPEVPTVAEQGYPDFSASAWLGFFAPANTPDDVVQKISTTLNESLQEPEVAAKLSALGLEVRFSDTPADFRKMVEDEYGRWSQVVKNIGVKLD